MLSFLLTGTLAAQEATRISKHTPRVKKYSFSYTESDGVECTVTRTIRTRNCVNTSGIDVCKTRKKEVLVRHLPSGKTEKAWRVSKRGRFGHLNDVRYKTTKLSMQQYGYYTRRGRWWQRNQHMRFYTLDGRCVYRAKNRRKRGARVGAASILRGQRYLMHYWVYEERQRLLQDWAEANAPELSNRQRKRLGAQQPAKARF